MTWRASDVGELALGTLSRGGEGRVSRVFPSSAYIRTADDFVVLLQGGLRSPLTVNFTGKRGFPGLRPGEKCELSPRGISTGEDSFAIAGAEVFHSSLLGRRRVALPRPQNLKAGTSMLKSLYDVASEGPRLIDDPALERFIDGVLSPVAEGRHDSAYNSGRYEDLIGRGGGFTPAGDDFVGGFLSVYNFLARQQGRREVLVPMRQLLASTIPESAAILAHAADGYVDELMERLILASTSEMRNGFHRELLSVARRGHTSGIDMSLGVLLGEAALSDGAGSTGTLQACLDVIWHP